MSNSRATRKVDDFWVQFLTKGEARPVEIAVPEDDPFKEIMNSISASVLQFLAPAVEGTDLAALLRPDRVIVRTIPPANFQALTVWVAPCHAIAVNRGVALYLYRIARALAEQYIVRGPEDSPAPEESETVGIMATILDWMASKVRAPLVDDWTVGPRVVKTAENFTTAAERFVLSHEIGHIFHRHLIADSSEINPADMSPADLDVRPLTQEAEADAAAVVFTIESLPSWGKDPRAGVAGMYFLLRALSLAEQVGGSPVDSSHLPADERLEVCRAVIDQRYGDASKLVGDWLYAQDALFQRLGVAAVAERERRRVAAAKRMERVFATTPWSEDRDMVAMRILNDEMQELIARAPSVVVEALENNLLDTSSYIKLEKSVKFEELESNDVWRRHQVAHFIARHSLPQVKAAFGITGF